MIKEIFENILVSPPGYYNMFTLEIEIQGKKNSESNPTVFHEYTHYLQNMTTINGFITLDKYIHVFLRSFIKLGSDTVDPNIPLCDNLKLRNYLGDKSIENILYKQSFGMEYDSGNKKYLFQKTDLDDYIISEEEYMDHYSGILMKIPYIAIDGMNIPLNEVTIRENMALVNSIIGFKRTDSITNDDIDEILSCKYKEYNVLFDFINHYLPNCNLLKLVYSICELALNINFSEQIIGNILRLIKNEYAEMSKMTTEKIIFLIQRAMNYDKIFALLNKIIHEKAITRTLELFGNFNPAHNQFVGILRNFYNFLIEGINYRANHKSFYIDCLTNEYIQRLTSIIGCPVIYLKLENEPHNLSETPEYFFKDFVYLHAALKVFMKLYYSQITSCPFIEYNVCNVSKNNECYSNCLKNYKDSYYENCLLSNALNCSGIRQVERNI
jgi:hypothetical protein